jgi:hypothetical protein
MRLVREGSVSLVQIRNLVKAAIMFVMLVGVSGQDEEEEEVLTFVEDFDTANFQYVLDDGWWFIKFCHRDSQVCADIDGTFAHVAQHFSDMGTIRMGTVDCTFAGDLCEEQQIKEYPTLRLYSPDPDGDRIVTVFSGSRSLHGLTSWLNEHS